MPSKNHPFLVLVAGKAGNEHQKKEDLGEASLPEPLQRVSRVIVRSSVAAAALVNGDKSCR
jgi:hypothetical protein